MAKMPLAEHDNMVKTFPADRTDRSPAVNDPSTAISCVDQLSRIIIHWTSRIPPPSHYYAPPHVLRLFVPWIGFDGVSIRRSSRLGTTPLPTSR
jgi:hypothetical protein